MKMIFIGWIVVNIYLVKNKYNHLNQNSKTLSKTDTEIEIDVRVPKSEEGASFYFNAVESAEELTL